MMDKKSKTIVLKTGPAGWTNPIENRWGVRFESHDRSVMQLNRQEPQ